MSHALVRRARRAPAAALAFCLAFFLASAASAAPTFPALTGRVVDEANVLSPATEAQLTQKLESLETSTHHQLVVVTLRNLQGMEIEDYGYQLGRVWGIGRAGADDGALFIVAPSERRVRIEVGYGLEPVLTDALSSVILNNQVLPRFRNGDIEGGVVAGTDAIIAQLSLPADQAQQNALAARTAQRAPGPTIPIGFIIFVVFWILLVSLRGGGAWWLWPIIISGSGRRRGGGWSGGSGAGWSGGGGGFSGGGGSFGGGGASGRW